MLRPTEKHHAQGAPDGEGVSPLGLESKDPRPWAMVEKKEWIEPIRAAHSHDPDALTQGAAMSCGRHHHDDDIKVLEGLSSHKGKPQRWGGDHGDITSESNLAGRLYAWTRAD